MNMDKKKLLFIVKLFVSISLIAFLIRRIDLHELGTKLQSVNIYLLMLMFTLPHLNILLSAFRWQLLLKALNIAEKLNRLFTTYLIGTFFVNFLPSVIGGDVVRVLHVSQRNPETAGVIAATFSERLIGLTALLSWVIFVLLHPEVSSKLPVIREAALVVFLGYAVLLFLLTRTTLPGLSRVRQRYKMLEKLLGLLSDTQKKMMKFAGHKITVLKVYTASLLFYMISMCTVYVAAMSLDIHVDFGVVMIVVPLTLLVGLLPISIGGLGVNEGSYVFFFSLFGMSGVDALSIALLLRSRIIFTGLLGGILFAHSRSITVPGE